MQEPESLESMLQKIQDTNNRMIRMAKERMAIEAPSGDPCGPKKKSESILIIATFAIIICVVKYIKMDSYMDC